MSKSHPADHHHANRHFHVPAIGEEFGDGFLGALVPAPDGRLWALVVAPKREGQHASIMWATLSFTVPGARSFTDGFANSEAMRDEHHPAARFCRALRCGGKDDWYLPSYCEQAAIWANLGPNHTQVPVFQRGGAEAYDQVWHWSSSEVAGATSFGWGQSFGDVVDVKRTQDDKYSPNCCRAIRRVLI